MPLSQINKDSLMGNVSVELASMFDRLTNQYSDAKHDDELLLLPELEKSLEAGFIKYCRVHKSKPAGAISPRQ